MSATELSASNTPAVHGPANRHGIASRRAVFAACGLAVALAVCCYAAVPAPVQNPVPSTVSSSVAQAEPATAVASQITDEAQPAGAVTLAAAGLLLVGLSRLRHAKRAAQG